MADKPKIDDPLYRKVYESCDWFTEEATKHKWLNRGLWIAASTVSVLVAITGTLDSIFTFYVSDGEPVKVSVILSLILPMVTGYVVLRSPEKLWIMETFTRNKLKDLKAQMELDVERGYKLDSKNYDQQYFEIMAEANKKWEEIKSGASG